VGSPKITPKPYRGLASIFPVERVRMADAVNVSTIRIEDFFALFIVSLGRVKPKEALIFNSFSLS
jgi:hypothetical protein